MSAWLPQLLPPLRWVPTSGGGGEAIQRLPPRIGLIAACSLTMPAIAMAAPLAMPAVKARARAAVLGSLLADAATMPLHWICECINAACLLDSPPRSPSALAAAGRRRDGSRRTAPHADPSAAPAATALAAAFTHCLPSSSRAARNKRSVAHARMPPNRLLPSRRWLRLQTMPARCRACLRARPSKRSRSSIRNLPAPSTRTRWAACLRTVRSAAVGLVACKYHWLPLLA